MCFKNLYIDLEVTHYEKSQYQSKGTSPEDEGLARTNRHQRKGIEYRSWCLDTKGNQP